MDIKAREGTTRELKQDIKQMAERERRKADMEMIESRPASSSCEERGWLSKGLRMRSACTGGTSAVSLLEWRPGSPCEPNGR